MTTNRKIDWEKHFEKRHQQWENRQVQLENRFESILKMMEDRLASPASENPRSFVKAELDSGGASSSHNEFTPEFLGQFGNREDFGFAHHRPEETGHSNRFGEFRYGNEKVDSGEEVSYDRREKALRNRDRPKDTRASHNTDFRKDKEPHRNDNERRVKDIPMQHPEVEMSFFTGGDTVEICSSEKFRYEAATNLKSMSSKNSSYSFDSVSSMINDCTGNFIVSLNGASDKCESIICGNSEVFGISELFCEKSDSVIECEEEIVSPVAGKEIRETFEPLLCFDPGIIEDDQDVIVLSDEPVECLGQLRGLINAKDVLTGSMNSSIRCPVRKGESTLNEFVAGNLESSEEGLRSVKCNEILGIELELKISMEVKSLYALKKVKSNDDNVEHIYKCFDPDVLKQSKDDKELVVDKEWIESIQCYDPGIFAIFLESFNRDKVRETQRHFLSMKEHCRRLQVTSLVQSWYFALEALFSKFSSSLRSSLNVRGVEYEFIMVLAWTLMETKELNSREFCHPGNETVKIFSIGGLLFDQRFAEDKEVEIVVNQLAPSWVMVKSGTFLSSYYYTTDATKFGELFLLQIWNFKGGTDILEVDTVRAHLKYAQPIAELLAATFKWLCSLADDQNGMKNFETEIAGSDQDLVRVYEFDFVKNMEQNYESVTGEFGNLLSSDSGSKNTGATCEIKGGKLFLLKEWIFKGGTVILNVVVLSLAQSAIDNYAGVQYNILLCHNDLA